MTPSDLLRLVPPLLLFPAGPALIAAARAFIRRMDGAALRRLPGQNVLLAAWMIFAGMVLAAVISGTLTPAQVFRAVIVGACSLVLTALDVARCWLPFRFTGSLLAAGLAFSLFILPERPALQLLAATGGTLAVLATARGVINALRRHEAIGLGDVWLLAALVAWYPLYDVMVVTTLALTGAAIVGTLTGQRSVPFGPYLCVFAVLPAFFTLEQLL